MADAADAMTDALERREGRESLARQVEAMAAAEVRAVDELERARKAMA